MKIEIMHNLISKVNILFAKELLNRLTKIID